MEEGVEAVAGWLGMAQEGPVGPGAPWLGMKVMGLAMVIGKEMLATIKLKAGSLHRRRLL